MPVSNQFQVQKRSAVSRSEISNKQTNKLACFRNEAQNFSTKPTAYYYHVGRWSKSNVAKFEKWNKIEKLKEWNFRENICSKMKQTIFKELHCFKNEFVCQTKRS